MWYVFIYCRESVVNVTKIILLNDREIKVANTAITDAFGSRNLLLKAKYLWNGIQRIMTGLKFLSCNSIPIYVTTTSKSGYSDDIIWHESQLAYYWHKMVELYCEIPNICANNHKVKKCFIHVEMKDHSDIYIFSI